jgi:hypothetical protein
VWVPAAAVSGLAPPGRRETDKDWLYLLLKKSASSEVQQQFWHSRPRACFLIGRLTGNSAPVGLRGGRGRGGRGSGSVLRWSGCDGDVCQVAEELETAELLAAELEAQLERNDGSVSVEQVQRQRQRTIMLRTQLQRETVRRPLRPFWRRF